MNRIAQLNETVHIHFITPLSFTLEGCPQIWTPGGRVRPHFGGTPQSSLKNVIFRGFYRGWVNINFT